MPTLLRTSASVVLRLAALLAVDVVFLELVEIPGDDGLGTGLLAFLVLVLLSGTWGLVDGLRRPFGRLATTWVLAGVGYALLSPVLGALLYPPVDWSVTLADVRDLAAFSAGLVCVPALLGGGLTAIVRSASSTTPSASAGPRG